MPPDCCLCGGPLRFWGSHPDESWGYGNNPDPLCEQDTDRCCDDCNSTKVIPARLGLRPGEKFSTRTTRKKP